MKNLYSTKLISRSTGFIVPLGILLILFGVASITLSFIDIFNCRSSLSNSLPISKSANETTLNTTCIQNSFSEQSIWPTLGKGIWVGLFYLTVGIFSLIAYREKTLISIRILSLFAFISVFLSFFLFLSSLIVFQRYIIEGRVSAAQRTSIEQKEVVLNVLLLVCGVLSLIISLILAIGTLIAGNFCQRQSDDFENFKYSNQQLPPPAYSAQPYYG
ncbi:unnamed protein product [Rotaria socialis]|uniref:Uncharacterized protein n=1 Tax=Rotaria socialis TaxID=392032 RepID=A0A821EQL3_9BILA|nr:unnamed protein product [Rotaria socialis]CAF3314786.1 unnamed protein product [Rotaria socialis]CAF3339969.1 unnamed protein product [Rotaria socialis]CAF3357867.1 unnamed protein product [Rotaria socialis]CAF3439272.1 unnamed protein product [Rotaria socialis]